jgi:hypothetical protein
MGGEIGTVVAHQYFDAARGLADGELMAGVDGG